MCNRCQMPILQQVVNHLEAEKKKLSDRLEDLRAEKDYLYGKILWEIVSPSTPSLRHSDIC
jgi:hypothetical protein